MCIRDSYAFFVSAFFPGKGGLIMAGLYITGIVIGILVALLFKGTLFKGEAVPFVMELPNYRLPGAKNVAQLLWEKDVYKRQHNIIVVGVSDEEMAFAVEALQKQSGGVVLVKDGDVYKRQVE